MPVASDTHSKLSRQTPKDPTRMDRYREIVSGSTPSEAAGKLPALPNTSEDLRETAERLWLSIPEPVRTPNVVDMVYAAAQLQQRILRGEPDPETGEHKPAPPTVLGQFRMYCESLGITPNARLRMAAAITALEQRVHEDRFDALEEDDE